jgi:hypothetical protein
MKINHYGQVTLSETELFDSLYSGNVNDFKNVYIDNNEIIDTFNQSCQINRDQFTELKKLTEPDISLEEFDKLNQQQWFIPEGKIQHNLVEMLYGMCNTDEQTNRVSEELELFIQHGMFDLLYYLKYLVDTMRENNIVWGVGRGSSVSSYVLYLIGVHKINSIKYNLDIKEFLK